MGLDSGVRSSHIGFPRCIAFNRRRSIISAGFDAHREDDMASLGLVESDYIWVTQRISEVAGQYASGRIISVLEGGYNLDALGRSVTAHLKVLAGV